MKNRRPFSFRLSAIVLLSFFPLLLFSQETSTCAENLKEAQNQFDKGHVELIFNWQYYYYFLNENGKKYLAEFLGLTEEVVPLTWK